MSLGRSTNLGDPLPIVVLHRINTGFFVTVLAWLRAASTAPYHGRHDSTCHWLASNCPVMLSDVVISVLPSIETRYRQQ